MRKYLFTILLSCLIYSCSQDPTRILPNRNIDKLKAIKDSINTPNKDIAPYLRVTQENCGDAFYRELRGDYSDKINSIKPANQFFKEILGNNYPENEKVIDELTNRLESATFLTYNSGVVAISHPPDSNFSNLLNLNMFGSIGGTDLLVFNKENNKFIFNALPEPINSIFWDSHPWIGQDSICNYVLIWASDKNNPYSMIKDINGNIQNIGNSDLFYSYFVNDKWSDPKELDFNKHVNTKQFNEISPFVACMAHSPKLLFSSNRDGDYDIYSANLKFNFKDQTIQVLDSAVKFPKGSQYDFENSYINTDANEMFPFIAFPYKQEGNAKALYFSSDRNNLERVSSSNGDTVVINKGAYDIYSFDIDLECNNDNNIIIATPEPQNTFKLHLTILDNKGEKIKDPVLFVHNISDNDSIKINADTITITLKKGKKYKAFGGSNYYHLNCDQRSDTIITHYIGKNYIINAPTINKNIKITKYDSIINQQTKYEYDTTFVTEIIPLKDDILKLDSTIYFDTVSNKVYHISKYSKVISFKPTKLVHTKQLKNKLSSSGLPTLNNTIASNDSTKNKNTTWIEAEKQIILKKSYTYGGNRIQKSTQIIYFDTIPNIDTINITALDAVIPSNLSNYNFLQVENESNKAIIYDTVIVEPSYYIKPNCNTDFITIESKYNKNVPYFQTAFWKVNTSKGLKEHLQDLQPDGYLSNAGYVELSPKHRKYGVAHQENRQRRIEDYRKYASQVDGNLQVMKNTITDDFIPIVEFINNYSNANSTRLLVKLEAYSDIRSASLCYYIGDDIEYMQGIEQDDTSINLTDIKIQNNATLSSDNDNLSKLRAYYGFNELFSLLKADTKFNNYLKEGLVFYPTQQFKSIQERNEALDRAKIIILAEGKYYDTTIRQDTEEYDDVRRLNLTIKLIQYYNGKFIPSECCK
ncbi:MAG TPA: hypothetical protein PLE30_02230 [Candidatus Kapabacteria bacterium]|nr:hypothetical protein [Candidatus Kapabacteria bacterium]